MKHICAVLCLFVLLAQGAVAQNPPNPPPNPQQNPPGTRVIQTPFGPKVVVDPLIPAPGETTPAAPAPAVPAAAPGAAPPQTPPPGALAAPAQVTQPAAPAQVDDRPSPISLHFDNGDIHQVIRIIGNALGLNYIIDPEVRGTVNISTEGELRRSDLLPILETILKINGATMVQTGNFYQIVPATAASREPLAVQERSAAVPGMDRMILQIVRMKYVAATEMARLLLPYVSEGGNIAVHESGNILLISERTSNLRKLLELVDIFDTNAPESERVRLLPVKNNLARDLVVDLQTIFGGYALSAGATAVRFVPIERMNSILVVTPNMEVFAEVEKWLERLDQPLQTAGLRNFIYKAKYARAVDLQKVLMNLYGTGVTGPTVINGTLPETNMVQPPAAPLAPGQTAAPPGGPPPAAGAPAGITSLTPMGQGIVPAGPRITADEINNALVIQTTPQVYAEIERALRELDVLRKQVLIDAQIYEVTLDDSIAFGLSAILQNKANLERQTTGAFAAPSGGGAASLSAQTFAYIGRTRELLLFLNASENRSRIRTLSAPSVLVSDNMDASFQVGAEVPIPTSSSVTPVQSDGTNLFAQTIQFRDTGVILRVRPQINEGGTVMLEINQEVSQASANTTSSIVAPVIGKSALSSTVVIQDGQTIALGGFIRENQDLLRNRVPVIGRLPVVGVLFGSTTNAKSRSELIVLITPHVLTTHSDADLATEELKSKLKEVKQLIK